MIAVDGSDYLSAAKLAGFNRSDLLSDLSVGNGDRLQILRHLADRTPASIMEKEELMGGKTLGEVRPSVGEKRYRTVNGIRQELTVEKAERHNGATIEMFSGPRGYPVLRVSKGDKDHWIVPQFGEGDIRTAKEIADKTFEKIVANAKEQKDV